MLHRALDKPSYIQFSIYNQPFRKTPLQFVYLFTAFFYFLKASVRSCVFALVLEGCIVAFPEAQLQDCGF